MGIFGWSYPPGAENDPLAPYNQDYPDDDLPTIKEFCEHIGIEPIALCLHAIDKYSMEAVDIKIEGTDEWLGPDDRRKLDGCSENDTICEFRVRGIAWDGSDWEWCEIVKGEDGFDALDQARKNFVNALHEHRVLMASEE